MAHIAVVLSGLYGRLHSGFEMMARLEDEGYRVTCLCQPYVADTVARQGFEFIAIPEINFSYNEELDETTTLKDRVPIPVAAKGVEVGVASPDLETTGQLGVQNTGWFAKLRKHFHSRSSRYEKGKTLLKLDEYKSIWEALAPDHALIDVELHDLIFTAYASGVPTTLFHTWFSDTRSLRLPPIRTAITPGVGIQGSKPGIAWAWVMNHAKIWGRYILNRLTFQEYRRSTLKRYAREVGFPVREMAISTLPPLYRFKKLPILLLAMKELDFPHRPADNLSYVGPMVYPKRKDLEAGSVDARNLETIFKRTQAEGKKLVYCSVGSLAKGDVHFLKRVIEAVSREPSWELILSLGRNLTEAEFPSTPSNVHLFSWVPQLQVIEQSDCCINHAGINSINECLHFGVPMVIYSMKYTDENGNAARMAYHGIAKVGNIDVDTADQIGSNIHEVLNVASYRQNMATFQERYRAYRKKELGVHLGLNT